MHKKSEKFKTDFGESRQLNNAMDLTSEFHQAKDPRFKYTPFGKKET